jgi:hypothetical protein
LAITNKLPGIRIEIAQVRRRIVHGTFCRARHIRALQAGPSGVDCSIPLKVFSNRTCLMCNSLRGSLILIDFGDFDLGREQGWLAVPRGGLH